MREFDEQAWTVPPEEVQQAAPVLGSHKEAAGGSFRRSGLAKTDSEKLNSMNLSPCCYLKSQWVSGDNWPKAPSYFQRS